MKRLLWILGIILTVLLGIGLRLWFIQQPSLWIDEAYSFTIAQAITQHGYPLLDSGQIIWRAPLYHYIAALGLLFTTDTIVVLRILSVISGLGAVIIVSFCAREFISKRAGWFVLIIMSLSYWEIAWSRQARMYSMFQGLFWLSLLLFYKYQKKQVSIWWVIAVTVATIAVHNLGWLLLPMYALYWIITKYNTKYLALIIASFILLGVISASLLVHYYTHISFTNYTQHYLWFIFTQHTVLVLAMLISCGVQLWRKKISAEIVWLSSCLVLGFGIVSYTLPLVQYRYWFAFLPAMFLVVASLDKVSSKLSKIALPLILVAMLFTGELIIQPQLWYPLESDSNIRKLTYHSITPQPNFAAAYDIIKLKTDLPLIITPYPMMTRYYLQRDDTAALYIDLIGNGTGNRLKQELYTGIVYATKTDLEELVDTKQHGIILLDSFAEQRILSDIRDYIHATMQPYYTVQQNNGSHIRLYRF